MADNQAVLQILLQLVDQLSGPAGDAAGSLGRIETKADDAAEAVEDVGEAAEETKTKLAETSDKGSTGMEKLALKFISVQAALKVARFLANEFSESITRMADSGDKNAQQLIEKWGQFQGAVQEAEDALVGGIVRDANIMVSAIERVTSAQSDAATRWQAVKEFFDPTQGIIRQREEAEAEQAAADATANHVTQINNSGTAYLEAANARGRADAAARSEDGVAKRAAEDQLALEGARKAAADKAGADRDAALAAEDFRKSLDDQRQAAEDAALAMADGVLAIDGFTKKMDEMTADGTTAEEMEDLVKGLYDASVNALELGKNVPLSQVEDLKGRAGDLTAALATMDLPPEVKEALLSYLALVNEKLAAANSLALNAGAAMAGWNPNMAGGGAGMRPPGGGGGEDISMASGGTLTEPVIGRGTVSGRRYTLGEVPETVTPVGSGGGNAITIFAIDVEGLFDLIDKHLRRE